MFHYIDGIILLLSAYGFGSQFERCTDASKGMRMGTELGAAVEFLAAL